jgi:hypothetical protein
MWACRLPDPGSVRGRWRSLPALVQSAPAARPLNWGWLGAKISLSGTLISAALIGLALAFQTRGYSPPSAATIVHDHGKPGYVTNVRGRSGGHLRDAPGKGDQPAGSFGTPKMISANDDGKTSAQHDPGEQRKSAPRGVLPLLSYR